LNASSPNAENLATPCGCAEWDFFVSLVPLLLRVGEFIAVESVPKSFMADTCSYSLSFKIASFMVAS
jgi:hypothetical protein